MILLVLSSSTRYALPAAATNPPSPPNLGTAIGFGVLAGSAVTNTGASVVVGNLGVSPGIAVTGFPPGTVTGAIHKNDATAVQAKTDLASAYSAISGDSCSSNLTGQNLGGLTLTPGVYCFSSAASLTGTLTLNAQGTNNAVFIFQIGSALVTTSGSSVVMTGGNACNVFWNVGSSAVLGADTTFGGNILALASIVLGAGASVTGAVLAQNAAVTLDSNHVGAYPTPCDETRVQNNVRAAGAQYNLNDAISLATGSSQFKQAAVGLVTTYSGANDGWSFNSSLGVSWKSVAVNFLATSSNGSEYTLSVSENPKTGVVHGARISPAVFEQISPGCSSGHCWWSGYAVAGNGNSPPYQTQVYEADAEWYIPTLSEPPAGQTTCTQNNVCNLSEWVGLTDESSQSGSGTIVQAGIYSNIYPNLNPPPQDNMLYLGWTEVYCTYGAAWCQPQQDCPNILSANPGDLMESTIENQYAVSGGAPSYNYYIYLNDWTQHLLCDAQPNGNPVTVGNSQYPFTPYYAAYIGEEISPVNYHLAQFSDWYFTLCAANFGAGYQGVYSNYDLGYGYGVYMYNNGNPNTSTAPMTQVGSGYGQFYVHWVQSSGT